MSVENLRAPSCRKARQVKRVDVLVIGGGVAGISAAAGFAQHANILVLERESALGYHSSGPRARPSAIRDRLRRGANLKEAARQQALEYTYAIRQLGD